MAGRPGRRNPRKGSVSAVRRSISIPFSEIFLRRFKRRTGEPRRTRTPKYSRFTPGLRTLFPSNPPVLILWRERPLARFGWRAYCHGDSTVSGACSAWQHKGPICRRQVSPTCRLRQHSTTTTLQHQPRDPTFGRRSCQSVPLRFLPRSGASSSSVTMVYGGNCDDPKQNTKPPHRIMKIPRSQSHPLEYKSTAAKTAITGIA